MKMVRVNSATMRRLAALNVRDASKRTRQHWTPILDIDAWSTMAMSMQAVLCTDTQKDSTTPTVASKPP